jgi:hypothetical protein
MVGKYQNTDVVFWPIAKTPHKLNLGDKVFVAVNGKIIYYHIFRGFAKDPKCEVSGRIIPGLVLLLDVPFTCLDKDVEVGNFIKFIYTEET